MPKLILHIGAHKTGTTSVQKFLEGNDTFLARHGFVYPHICWYGHAHHRLSLAVKGETDPGTGDIPLLENELAELRNFAASTQATVIISSEIFFAIPESKLRRFVEGIRDFDIQVVACVRRQDNLYMSNFNELTKRAKNNSTRPITFFLDNPLAISADLDLLGCLNTWASLVGRDRIATYCYESGDAVALFLETLGLPVPEQAKSNTRANVSVPIKALELVRLAKTMNQDIAVRTILLSEATRAFAGTSSVLLAPEQRRRLLKRFETDNEKLFTTYLHRENLYSEEFCKTEFEAQAMQPTEPLNNRDVLKVLIEMASIFARMGVSPALLRENNTDAET